MSYYLFGIKIISVPEYDDKQSNVIIWQVIGQFVSSLFIIISSLTETIFVWELNSMVLDYKLLKASF